MTTDKIYDGLEVNLGFEMWASIRWCFLGVRKSNDPERIDDFMTAVVEPWGLRLDQGVTDQRDDTAGKRFGEMNLGCIHSPRI